MDAKIAEVTRGTLVEAVHEGSVAVVTSNGTLVAQAGDATTTRFFRSSAKPFQAMPVVTSGAADAFGLTSEELALCCASHNATEDHQRIVASILAKSGRSEGDLQCGFSSPLDEEEKARITLGLTQPDQIACECSGEHAGMLATCTHRGWPVESYTSTNHPLQQEIRKIVGAACGLAANQLVLATDGCSIPTFGATVRAFAHAFAMLSDPDGAVWNVPQSWRTALLRIREAMVAHPELISGEGEIDTVIMQWTRGRVVAKLGAEGLLCLSVPGHGLGIAISDAGGSSRSLGPAAVAVLEQLGIEDEETMAALRNELCPPITNFAGDEVGEIRTLFTLNPAEGANENTITPQLTSSPRSDIASIH